LSATNLLEPHIRALPWFWTDISKKRRPVDTVWCNVASEGQKPAVMHIPILDLVLRHDYFGKGGFGVLTSQLSPWERLIEFNINKNHIRIKRVECPVCLRGCYSNRSIHSFVGTTMICDFCSSPILSLGRFVIELDKEVI
jgi:hypothetical protein